MRKYLLTILILFLGSLIFTSKAEAFLKTTFVTVVNPVRGLEGWTDKNQTPLDFPNFQYQEATKSALPITWLLRFDVVNNATLSANFRDLIATDSSQTLGAFLEVTPKLAQIAKVTYPDGDDILQPHRVFLSGYTQEDRIKLIDVYMEKYFNQYGTYPKTVGAWYIDSYSLSYLADKYSVLTAVICDDQYTTDHYRIWGSYLGSPYYPSKVNTLVPASDSENKINLVIVKWAMRDPYHFYGTGAASSFSVQVNDYLYHNLDTNYFNQLLKIYSQKEFNEFTQIVIGLENGYSLKTYRQEVENVYRLLKQRQNDYGLSFVPLSEFGDWFKARYPESSPAFVYYTADPLGNTDGQVLLYQNPFYRIILKKENNQTKIIDFRIYNQKEGESHYISPNTEKTLFAETPSIIDSVKFPGSSLLLDFNLEINALEFTRKSWIFSATDSAKTITFEPQKIIFSNFIPPAIDQSEILLTKDGNNSIWKLSPRLPFTTSILNKLFNLLKIIFTIFLIIILTKTKFKKISKLVLLTALIVIPISLIPVYRSGLVFPFGLGFWGPNGHDAVFHLSLINSFKNSFFSLVNPQISGQKLQNYHLAFDYLSAFLSRTLNLPLLDLYFRYLPLLLASLIFFLTLKLINKWNFSRTAKIFSLLGIFLTGSLGFIPGLLFGKGIFYGESIFWANQSVSLLLNPPFALSIIVLLLFFIIFEKHQSQPSTKKILLLILLGGLLSQIKVYAFILLLASLFIYRQFRLLLPIIIIGVIISLPFLGLSSSPFIFQPFWFTKGMIAAPDRLNLRAIAEAWQVYENSGQFFKLFTVNLLALVIFLIGNLGIRLLGFINLFSVRDKFKSQKIISLIILIGILFPLFFVQKLNPWNTIQFLYYSQFFLVLFAAAQISKMFRYSRPLVSLVILILVISFSLPTTIGTLKDYLTGQSAARISFMELRALDVLKKQPKGIVISALYQPFYPTKIYDPKPLYAYTSTAYISALSGQPEYLSDTINLNITGFDYREKTRLVQRFYNTTDNIWAKEFLKENRISFIYENPLNRLEFNPESIGAQKIFDSGEINLYKFNPDE